MLVTLLRQIAEQTKAPMPDMSEPNMDESSYVSNRLAELLPLEILERQQLLEAVDPVERLRKIFIMLRDLQARQDDEDPELDDA